MTREKYFEVANRQFANGTIDEDVFWAMVENADFFCEDGDKDEDEYEIEHLF
jgi:hypothetical protein